MSSPPDTPKSDILRLLELCRDIELCCAELYQYYAQIFAGDHELSALWAKTSREEVNHANQFVMAINMRRENMVASVSIDAHAAETVFNAIKTLYDKVRSNSPPAVEALRSAIKVEERLAMFHMDSIASFNNPSYQQLFAAMMKADQSHTDLIVQMHNKLTQSP